jgi:hypothetical protein
LLDIRPHYLLGAGGTGISSQFLKISYIRDISICKMRAFTVPTAIDSYPLTIGSPPWTPEHIPIHHKMSGPSAGTQAAPTITEGRRIFTFVSICHPITMSQEDRDVCSGLLQNNVKFHLMA